MPDRRIDALGKSESVSWGSMQSGKGSSNMLRVISGQLGRVPGGEVITAVVQKASNGSFKIQLNGETFIVKGLPASLLGKEVSFIVRKGAGGMELFWLGASRSKSVQMPVMAESRHSRPSANVLSALSAGLRQQMQTGALINGRIDSIQAGKMNLTLSMAVPERMGENITQQIQTTAIQGLKPGQQLSLSLLAGANNQPVMEIHGQQAMNQTGVTAGRASAPLEMASFKLAAGDMTAAIVQKRLPNGLVQLNIQGTVVETAAPQSVVKGDVLLLKMAEPPAGFQLMSVQKNATEKAMMVLKNNVSLNHESLANNITAMRNLLPAGANHEIAGLKQLEAWLGTGQINHDAATTGGAAAKQSGNGAKLAQLMRESGAGMEARLLGLAQQAIQPGSSSLQDLKGIMLQLSQAHSDSIDKMAIIKSLIALSQHSSARIESTQALNVLAQIQGDPIRFELPILVGQQMVNVQMSMQQEGYQSPENGEQHGASDPSYSVLFALELSQLGHLRVDASISDHSVHARIYSDRDSGSQFIRDHIQRLEARLQSLGYDEVYVLAAQTSPPAEKQRRFEQLSQMAPSAIRLLDVVA